MVPMVGKGASFLPVPCQRPEPIHHWRRRRQREVESAAELIAHIKGIARRIAAEGRSTQGSTRRIRRSIAAPAWRQRPISSRPRGLHLEVRTFRDTTPNPSSPRSSATRTDIWNRRCIRSRNPPAFSSKRGPACRLRLAEDPRGQSGSCRRHCDVAPPPRQFHDRSGTVRRRRNSDHRLRPRRYRPAHKPDEFVAAAQIAQCETFLLRLAELVRLTSPDCQLEGNETA